MRALTSQTSHDDVAISASILFSLHRLGTPSFSTRGFGSPFLERLFPVVSQKRLGGQLMWTTRPVAMKGLVRGWCPENVLVHLLTSSCAQEDRKQNPGANP